MAAGAFMLWILIEPVYEVDIHKPNLALFFG